MEALTRSGVGSLVSGTWNGTGVGCDEGATSSLSIRARQRLALEEMLKAGSGHNRADDLVDETSGDDWKVLIYDENGRDIIAPLLRVADLRALGVTLHLSLGKPRQAIPDVPAVYFVAPTEANVRAVAADVRSGLYDSFALNFTSRLQRDLLELLAELVAAPPHAQRVTRVFDMYTEFSALENDLFTINVPTVYPALNNKNATAADVDGAVEKIVDGLFCAIATLGVVPVIRSQRAGPAEMVATALDARLREALVSRNNIFAEAARFSGSVTTPRPLLIIVDRSLDVPVMLHHTWTYQALAHDTLGMKLNRVKVNAKDASGAPRPRTFDLDKSDEFWRNNARLPFPMVAEAVEGALQKYKSEVPALNLPDDSTIPDDAADAETAKKLAAAVQNIPELRKRKVIIDLHTSIATALLDQIKDRGLDGFFQVEEELLQRPGSFNVQKVVALINGNRGTNEDKLRVFLIYLLCVDAPDDALNECTTALRNQGVTDLRAYEFLRSIKAYTQSMASIPAQTADQGALGAVGAVGTQFLGTLSQVAENVGRLVVAEDKAGAAARVVNTLMEQRGDQDVLDSYLLLDPKAPGGQSGAAARKQFREAVLFVVGPGNYVEYQNCQDHVCATVKNDGAQKKLIPNGKSLIYGATELCTGAQFLNQLHELGGPKVQQNTT